MGSRIAFPQIDVDDVLNCFKSSIRRATNEEGVRIGVSRCIEEKVLKSLGITQYGHYEYTLVSGARLDALYGHVIIEYKAPGRLSSAQDVARAKEQLVKYISGEAPSRAEWDRYLGVIVSDRIVFVRYHKQQNTWLLRGPYDITRESIIKLIEALRGLRRKALRVDTLLEGFGPRSELARRVIPTLYSKLVSSKNLRTRMLFEDWMRLFKQATGYSPEKLRELPKLASDYGLQKNVDMDALMFSIQTYYAFVMKLIAAEVVYIYGGGRFYKSYVAELEDAYTRGGVDALRDVLRELESGGVFRQLGYENFLEGDYFSWYLEELNEELAEVLAEIARRLADYEPATPQLEPEYARDLLKRLYQQLVPREVRHNLGEYYTPDWLADLLMDEAGLSLEALEKLGEADPLKPLQIRVLDPACGSGTFLVRYISRLRTYAREHFLEDLLANYLLENVVGYDLNPLAVLTARTNYLLMVADLPKRGRVEIPVYLADSLMVERKTTLTGDVYVLKTIVGEFRLPVSLVERGALPKVLSEVLSALRGRYTVEDFRGRVQQVFKDRDLPKSSIDALVELYHKLLKLEEEGKNDVWISVIRNAFAPILKGKFNYVVGNPPWINWENLPEDYRDLSRDLWEHYGILGKGAGFKRDLSMLFLARCFDLYLKSDGKLAFLLPLTVFKTQAGAGFRKFLVTKTNIHTVHDLVALYPFEGAINRTSAIIIEKICESSGAADFNKCPDPSTVTDRNRKVRHTIWISRTGNPIPTGAQLEEVLRSTDRYQAIMVPIVERDPSSPWMQITEKVLPYLRRVITGESPYTAHEGVLTGLNQVFYVQVKGKLPDGRLLITNPPESGQKKRVKQVEAAVEPDLIYPLVRGRDAKKWYVHYSNRYIIITHDPETGKPLPEKDIKVRYPETYSYLHQFKKDLMNRTIKPFLSLREKMKKSKSQAERTAALRKLEENFHILDDIGSYTFAPYKVVWKLIAGAITGKAISFECAVLGSMNEKPFIPNEKLMMIPFNNLDEAYYVAGVLNSSISRLIVASYNIETEISAHIVKHITVPKFNADNSLHMKISILSRKAHEITKCIHAPLKPDYCKSIRDPEDELKKIERELDKAVAELYSIPEEVLKDFKRLLDILAGEGASEEIKGSEESIPPSVDFTKIDVSADRMDYIEVSVSTAGVCSEVKLSVDAPWGSQVLSLGDGRHRIEVSLPEGMYELKYKFTCSNHSGEGVVRIASSKSVVAGPRKPSTLKLGVDL